MSADLVRKSLTFLGLCGKPTLAEIRVQYLRLAKKFHPDVNGGSSEKMKQINAAYEAIQANASLLVTQEGQSKPAGKDIPERPKKPRSPSGLYVDLTVAEEDKEQAFSHPYSYCPQFTLHDDINLYRSIQMGNTARQVARSFGISEDEVRNRVESPQFKRRVLLAKAKTKPRPLGRKRNEFFGFPLE